MPYWRLFYHFVWGTKGRAPLIDPAIRETLHRAIAAKANDLGAITHTVGGTDDHVHLVVSIPPSGALSTFIGQVKGNTSHFVNHEIRPGHVFHWQGEYGVVSFGERHLGWVVQYVLNQVQHHEQRTIVRSLEQVSDG